MEAYTVPPVARPIGRTPPCTTDFIAWDTAAPAKRSPTKKARKPWSWGKIARTASFYLSGIERTVIGRHCGACHTDDARAYFDPAVNLMVAAFITMREAGQNPRSVDAYAWALKYTPRLTVEHPRSWFDAVVRKAMSSYEGHARPPVLPSADAMADLLRVTHAEVVAFKLKGYGAIDRRAPQRKIEDKAKRAAREKVRRKAQGAVAHEDSMSRTKPWDALGMSRAKFYRKVDSGKLPAHPAMRKARSK